MNFDLLHVGQTRSEWKGMTDGYIMEYNNMSGLILFVFFKNPLPEELEMLSTDSRFKVTFTEYEGVGFFCIKFGALPWGDCAFSPNLYNEKPEFCHIEDGKGYPFNVIVIDGETGTIKAIRTIGLGNQFSKRFREWCEESLSRNMTRSWYERKVKECYDKYEIRQLVKRAYFQYELYPHGEDKEYDR